MRLDNCEALKIGLAGTLITFVLNMIAYLALKHPSALPYHDQWWSSWFFLYVIWLIFLLVGFIHKIRPNDKGE